MNKSIYRYSPDLDEKDKIHSVSEYIQAENKFFQIEKEIKEQIEKLSPKDRFPLLNKTTQEFSRLLTIPCPDVLVSICPYCERKIWAKMKNGVFTLNSWFWVMEYDDGKTVTEDSKCDHLFAMDGALHLNNQDVPQKIKPFSFIRTKIYMGAEVPFIKPRILNRQDVIVVIGSIVIAEKYIGYPIAYFSLSKIPQKDFITGWAREEYCDRDFFVKEATFSGRRSEHQDYNLEKWINLKKIKWLFEEGNDLVLNPPDAIFPYLNVTGRRHPYTIQNGTILDLPDPLQEESNTILETFMPGQ